MAGYILGIDQSTQGTKALLFDENGKLTGRCDVPHEQIIVNGSWVEHNPVEIFENTLKAVRMVIEKTGIDKNFVVGVGISNQRETSVVWNRTDGKPVYNAIVWQCARGKDICKGIEEKGHSELIKKNTGLPLSPYFSAAKIKWIIDNVEGTDKLIDEKKLCAGTMDSWLVFKLTDKRYFKTDFSNASRTQLFNIHEQNWDKEICDIFGIDEDILPKVCDSDALYGYSNFYGYFSQEIPIHAVMGDSHGALFGQGCHSKGMVKATYGTGSSVMMNVGEAPIESKNGLVSSVGWKINGIINYVLEGNINYAGAVIRWLKEDLKLISSAKEVEPLAKSADKNDTCYLVPAFSGLGAPHWNSNAKAILCGMTRSTGKAEIVKAAEECIAYQISDIVNAMNEDSSIKVKELRADGGPTNDSYLMQFQSDILNTTVNIPDVEELSGLGVAYAAGISIGFYEKEKVFGSISRNEYTSSMTEEKRAELYKGWKNSVKLANS